MNKLILAAATAAAFAGGILGLAPAASAGYWLNGIYYPTCMWIQTYYGPQYVCG